MNKWYFNTKSREIRDRV